MNAQDIKGSYRLVDTELTVADIGHTYTFNEDGTFRNTTHEHLNKNTISEGTYSIQQDTLAINYKSNSIENNATEVVI